MGLLLRQLKKTYVGPDGSAVPVIDIAELYLADGEQAALIGASGCGKTTLLHLIAGILMPDGGSVLFGYDPANPAGDAVVDLTSLSESQRDEFRGRYIGYIFQTHHLLAGFTALENVLLGMTFTGRKHDRAWAAHLLSEVGLSDRLHYRPQKLSLGQQQRVAVARALANRPQLVLADEPTGALDAANAQQVLDLIRQLCTEVGTSLLLVSHDMEIARQLPKVLPLAQINRAAGGRR
ncbi:MAG: ABC transporter ATP-binding protein [Tepidisphaeraceae bacterium]|jgi:putative ABC transport system ATP-binding protein